MYYPSSEHKGVDQLRGHREADLHLCFRLCRLLVFPWGGSNNIHYLVNKNDAYSPTMFEALERTGRVHLTPAGRASPCKQGMCLQIACSETEVKLVKAMNSNHRNCYKILKDMFETREEISGHMIISDVLKMLVLKHASECTEQELTGTCIMKIIRHIQDNYLPYKLKPSARPQVPELGPVFFKDGQKLIRAYVYCYVLSCRLKINFLILSYLI